MTLYTCLCASYIYKLIVFLLSNHVITDLIRLKYLFFILILLSKKVDLFKGKLWSPVKCYKYFIKKVLTY